MTRFLAIGECLVELGQAEGGLLRPGFAGDTFNAAYYARLFLPDDWQVAYLSAVGTDKLSRDMLDFMTERSIRTEDIRQIEGATPGLYMIHLANGERSFSYWRSASAARRLADDPAHLRLSLEKADVIVFSGITLAILSPDARETLLLELRRAKTMGKRIAFDPNIRPKLWEDADTMRSAIEAGARAASLLMPSFDDERTHFGDEHPDATVARYRDWGAKAVVVKNGAAETHLSFGGEPPQSCPAAKVETVVDTTSAGDSYNGAFLARYFAGSTPADAAAFAARVAAAVISHPGALVDRRHLPAV